MSTPNSGYSEATEQDRPSNLPLSHLSIEVGHFYMEDLLNGEDRIRAQFRQVAPWVQAAMAATGQARPRVSTCFLVDDYFRDDTSPGKIVDKLTRIAAECGVEIDYLAREAGCAVTDRPDRDPVQLAEMVVAMLLPEPPAGTNGSRPPLHESGWLCNGERSPASDTQSGQAMQVKPWQPPMEFGGRNHSIFLDVELWKDVPEQTEGRLIRRRVWSCPLLASIWHLLRLGMLRYYADPVAVPQPPPPDGEWPDTWPQLPAVMRLNPDAAPFAAYRTLSVMPRSYLGIEHAVDVILNHIDLDQAVIDQVIERGRTENIAIPRRVTQRISHVFTDTTDPSPVPDADRG